MAEGVRVRHHTRRSQIVAVPMLSLPLKKRDYQTCRWCGETHLCKVAHLLVDSEGTAIISRKTWELIRSHAPKAGGFQVANPVRQPPKQQVKPALAQMKVKVFDLDDGKQPIHTVDLETVIQHLKKEVPAATEEQIRAFLLAKVLEQGAAVTDK